MTGLSGKGIKNHVIVQPSTPMVTRFASEATVHTIRMTNDLDLKSTWKMATICQSHSIDIIHAHTARGHSLGLLTKKLLRLLDGSPTKPVIHRRVQQRKRTSIFERLKYREEAIDSYICVSQAVARELAVSGVNPSKIRFIYRTIDAAPFTNHQELRTDFSRKAELPENYIIVACIGAIESQKGSDILINACSTRGG